MAAHNKTLYLIASKLGLAGDEKVLGKAAELDRLLQTKNIAGSNITDTSKIVICLDLAAGMLGADLDQKIAIKYAGLKPSMYTNSKKMIQNLLEIDREQLTTSMLCAALRCNEVLGLANKILEEYKTQSKMEIDLNLPQYVCMAVYHACRINKVKVSKVKINEKSRLKPSQWSKLDADWSKFVDTHFATKKHRGRPPKNSVANEDQELMDIDIPQKEENSESQIEPYEDWKHRMLETAYKELLHLESKKEFKNQSERQKEKEMQAEIEFSPRRSPRKTPQKYSPYKSPTKANGVRLLFP